MVLMTDIAIAYLDDDGDTDIRCKDRISKEPKDDMIRRSICPDAERQQHNKFHYKVAGAKFKKTL